MNADVRHLIKTVAIGGGIVLIGGAVLAWPAYRKGMQLRREIASLEYRTAISPATADEERRLLVRVAERRNAIASECREIPVSPDVAEIFHRLSLPKDDINVLDQSFTTGVAGPAGSDPSWPERAMPLTIDLRGTFESGFSLVRAVERMDRLLRITSLHIGADPRSDDTRTVPQIRMTLGVEAIFLDTESRTEAKR